MADDNVIVVRFEDSSKAYEALSVLKDADAQGRVELGAAEVVERTTDGTLRQREGDDGDSWIGTASGSLIGILIGVLGGPLGLLLGFGTGALAGAVYDADQGDSDEAALADLAAGIPAGATGLVAIVGEVAVEVVDGAMGKLGGTVVRRSRADVLAELEAAEDAQEAAEKEARHQLREKRRKETKEEWTARVDKLKAKLSHG
jgi:uncharacterized membrane protein